MARNSTFNLDLSENVAYDNPAFPSYIRYGTLSLYPDYSALSHWHEDFEFMLILHGTTTYNINGELVRLSEGDGIFINSRQLHYGFSPTREDSDFYCILLHPSLLSSNDDFTRKYVTPFQYNADLPYLKLMPSISWQKEILEDINTLYLQREKEMAAFTIQYHFFHIFELLYANSPISTSENSSSEELDTLKTMILYIQEHFSEKISLSQIAASGSCCKSKCSFLFNQYLHEPPVSYLMKYRLGTSLPLLQDTKLSITEIALECGFSGASYYCEMFHRQYKMTPMQYRKH